MYGLFQAILKVRVGSSRGIDESGDKYIFQSTALKYVFRYKAVLQAVLQGIAVALKYYFSPHFDKEKGKTR